MMLFYDLCCNISYFKKTWAKKRYEAIIQNIRI